MGRLETRIWRAIVAYDGTEYRGFQVQAEGPTIQGELERALERLTGAPVRVQGAGRTDAGVHAIGQVISFAAPWRHSSEDLCRALNATLPRDIAVRRIGEAEATFHARYSAQSRLYVYHVYASQERLPLLERYAHHVAAPLPLEELNRAAAFLVGEHDFATFGQPPVGENTVRVVHRAGWNALPAQVWGGAPEEVHLYRFEIEANAFLRGMVRRIVGALLEVGAGRLGAEDVAALLEACDISQACPPAPACGLCLWQVRYGQGERGPQERYGEE